MKKIFAMLLAVIMVFSLATVAFAAEGEEPTEAPSYTQDGKTYNDISTVTLTKVYKLQNPDTTSPAETFEFSALTCTKVENAADGVTKDNAPVPTIGNVSYIEGEANVDGTQKSVTINLPELGSLDSQKDTNDRYVAFPSVGVYTYTFKETDKGVAGVTYYDKEMTLVITVVQDGDNGKLRIAGVHCESPVDASNKTDGEQIDGTKKDTFENVYSAGKLKISKTVTGNLGDRDEYFDVKVTFTSEKPVNADITVSGGKYETEFEIIPASDSAEATGENVKWTSATAEGVTTYTAEKTIQVKHDDTVTFSNIPYGVEYKVEETDYSGDGYKTSYKFTVNADKMVGNTMTGAPHFKVVAAEDYVAITNNKESEVDTGIALDSMPYVLILAVAAIGLVLFTTKKRVQE